MAKQIAEFLSRLHNFPIKKAKKVGFTKEEWTIKNWKEEFRIRKKTFFPILSMNEIYFVNKFYRNFLKLKVPLTKVLTHNDLSDDHILIEPQKGTVKGVIDFGDASLGDPAVDFAWLGNLGYDFITAIYKNYNGPKDANFLHRTKYYGCQMFMSYIYHGVKRKNKKTLKEGLSGLRKLMRQGFS